MTTTTFTQLDSRKRVTLGSATTATQFIMTVEDNGRIILDPAVVMTQVERDYLENTEARAAVERALANPEAARPRSRKRA
jgi:hypothetical protein